MVADAFIKLMLWLWNNITLRFFPVDIPFLSLATLQGVLDQITAIAQPIFNFINPYFPLDTLFILTLAVLSIYLLTFVFRAIVFFINIARGSGA